MGEARRRRMAEWSDEYVAKREADLREVEELRAKARRFGAAALAVCAAGIAAAVVYAAVRAVVKARAERGAAEWECWVEEPDNNVRPR